MKRLFFLSVVSVSILSWIFFLFLTIFTLSPSGLIKAIDQFFIPSVSIEFSELQSTGNALNKNLKFFNLNIIHNENSIIQVKELELGLSIQPQDIFGILNINSIALKGGHLNHPNVNNTNSFSRFFLNFNEEISLSFNNFEYRNNESTLEINGSIFGKLSGSFSGQLNFFDGSQLSTIALGLVEESYLLSINLHSFKWFSLIPALSNSPLADLTFQMNALGELKNDQSIISGSFNSNDLLSNSLSIKSNKGSFQFQSVDDIGILHLTEFLHPFIDEQRPIQVNFQEKSLKVPSLYLTPEIFESDVLKVKNLIIEKFFISFDSILPKFSGIIEDLDLSDLYFDEINNLSGDFSGYGRNIKFIINSNASMLKNHKKDFIPVSISGAGNFFNSTLGLKAIILNKLGQIDLALQVDANSENSLSIELKGYDISKDLITFSLQKSLNNISSYIDRSIELLGKNSVYFNFSKNSSSLNSNFKFKVLSNKSKLSINKDLIFDFSRPIIEADDKNLYLFSSSGKVANFLFEPAYGLLNYETEKIDFYSLHDIAPIDLRTALNLMEDSIDLPYIQAEQKGRFQLSDFSLNNAISVKVKKFSIPISKSYKVNFDEAKIYIVDLDQAYGLLSSSFMQEELAILLTGKDITSSYDLTFTTNINLDIEKFFKDLNYLQISGNDLFLIDFNIKKNSPSILKVNSDLKDIEIISSINSLSKNKFSSLPTEILITNFLNPSVKLSNQKIDMHFRDISNYDGYIAIGKKLPDEFQSFAYEPGLNLYIYSDGFNEKLLSSIFLRNSGSTSIQPNKLAFDIKNFEFFNNNFSNISGLIELSGSEIRGDITGDELNLNFKMDQTGFLKAEIKDSTIPSFEFLNSSQPTLDIPLNSRLIVSNSSFEKLKIKKLDVYLLNNKKNFTANNIQLSSNLMSIKPSETSSAAYFSIDKIKSLYKLRGDYLIKDSKKIPYLQDLIDFSYFNGSINLQWKKLSELSYIEGESNFLMKDLVLPNSFSNSLAFNLLGVLNLKNILSKIANIDLSIDEFTSTQLNRVEGDLIFSKSKLRLASPLIIDTNAAKMRWVGQINKNSKNNLENLDLNLDLRVRFGENLPWYAAILGGLPAVAGSAVLNEIFEADINDLTNYQYEILGTISDPKLLRIK